MAKASVSDDCIDMVTPWNEYLSAKYKRSFAYHTVRNRLPVTVTQVIDHLSRSKEALVQTYGEGSREEIKQIIGYLSKLKNEMQTNKPLISLEANEVDASDWNNFLNTTEERLGRPLLWFADVWLHIECYLYRRIRESFALTKHLNQYDPFRHQKEEAFTGSLQAISVVGSYLLKLIESDAKIDTEQCVLQFLKLSLWGNRCDLSISGGKDISQVENPLDMISTLDELILVNDLQKVWSALNSTSSGPKIIDIIFDNSGYELFSDLCLAHLLVKLGLANKIRFHGKRVPWFISDVMEHDFHWLIQEMANQTRAPCLSKLSTMWKDFLSSGTWTYLTESFWTLPYSYDAMKQIDPELYNSFEGSKLLIFKGDLNYRKLVGDVFWPHTEKFSVALRGFEPAPLVTLRTIKADVVVGLQPGQAEKVAQKDTDWLVTGKYAVVSCLVK
ncbi:damage-control phosphatase ARMT1-like [Thrips palmi]|uniref:Sugar phosphate phosphatase n=1 Tax=Thrips palmi TaxID=161013 RepID=A0A6P8ZPB3_THRPL|nr:damage-control phosphatase ARMT1-like [Thrips palmi]